MFCSRKYEKTLTKLKKFSCPNSPKSRITYHLKSCTYCRTGYIYIQHWGEDIAFFPLGAHKCKIAIFIPTCSCHKINQKMWHFNMWGMHLHILFFKTSFRTRFFMIYSTTWWCAKLIQLCLLIHSKKMFFLKIPTRFGNTCVGSSINDDFRTLFMSYKKEKFNMKKNPDF